MIVRKLLDAKQDVLAYILARYFYRTGQETISDEEYDKLEIRLKVEHPELEEYFNRTYDDDPVPYRILKAIGLSVEPEEVDRETYKFLEEEKSYSIKAVRTMADVYNFYQQNQGRSLMCSLKLDGVNMKSLWLNGDYRISLSRGRASNSLNYTTGAKYIMPGKVNFDGVLKITGECFATELDSLRDSYGKDYKTAKSSAISMLRVEHKVTDYGKLKFKAFFVDGEKLAKVSDMYNWLEENDFETPPHFVILPDEGMSFEEFSTYFEEKMTKMAEMGKEFPADGMVLEVDDLESSFSESGQYSERQIAVKFGPWGFSVYEGEVVDIVFEQQRVYKSCRIRIKPIKTDDGCNAEWINGFNADIIIKNGINIGSIVQFERNSDAVNELIVAKEVNEF